MKIPTWSVMINAKIKTFVVFYVKHSGNLGLNYTHDDVLTDFTKIKRFIFFQKVTLQI